MLNINGEYYLHSINPGHWQVAVEANEPFRNVRYEVNDIRPGTERDLGEIRLQR